MRRSLVVLATYALAGMLASAAWAAPSEAATSPHARAKTSLSRCLQALGGLLVGPVAVNTPDVPTRNREQQAVAAKCDNKAITNLAFSHPKDSRLEAAREAINNLDLGVLDYGQYLVNLAFGHTGQSLLHSAEREIAAGRTQARREIPKL